MRVFGWMLEQVVRIALGVVMAPVVFVWAIVNFFGDEF